MDRTEAIHRQFGANAARYAMSSYHQTSPDLAAMVAAAVLDGSERLLDVGTGTGHTALAFASHVAEVVGLDLTTAMLEQARRLAREQGATNTRFELGDAMALPYPDASFDVVACRVCAHHFADSPAAVREMARVLRPGGQLLLVDSVSAEDPAEDTYLNCIELLRDPSHVRNYSVSQWLAMLDAAGLDAHWRATWPVPLDFEEWVERMDTPDLERRELRALFDRAPDAIRRGLGIRTGDRYGFDIPIGLIAARRR
jgi:ubiquinone/menaquinone biosynthesis C-methylase UbiE